MYRTVVHRRVVKYLKKLPAPQKQKIKETLSELSQNPFEYDGVKNMLGDWAGYRRIRIGDFRIIYWIDKVKHIIYVDHIGPRGDVYKA